MKTTILRKMAYSGTYIYVLNYNYNYTFQYLFAWRNEMYQQEVIFKPSFWKRLLWLLRIIDSPYTEKQIEQQEAILLSGAMASIDELKKIKKVFKKKVVAKQNDCQWQARSDNDGQPIYLCLTHNKVAQMEDNPHHD